MVKKTLISRLIIALRLTVLMQSLLAKIYGSKRLTQCCRHLTNKAKMKRVKFIELQRTTPVVFATENSEGYAYLLPYRYMANQRSDGKPVNVFAKLNAKLTIPVKKIIIVCC